eukprot:SAG22_NODE_1425_length_4459_cov_5.864220_5_plen_96_part_00
MSVPRHQPSLASKNPLRACSICTRYNTASDAEYDEFFFINTQLCAYSLFICSTPNADWKALLVVLLAGDNLPATVLANTLCLLIPPSHLSLLLAP